MRKYHDTELGYRVLLLLGSFLILNTHQGYIYLDKGVLIVLFTILIISVLDTYLPYIIGSLWRRLGDWLNGFMRPIILVPIYFLIFVPISFVSRLFAKQNPFILNFKRTSFISSDKTFDENDLKNLW